MAHAHWPPRKPSTPHTPLRTAARPNAHVVMRPAQEVRTLISMIIRSNFLAASLAHWSALPRAREGRHAAHNGAGVLGSALPRVWRVPVHAGAGGVASPRRAERLPSKAKPQRRGCSPAPRRVRHGACAVADAGAGAWYSLGGTRAGEKEHGLHMRGVRREDKARAGSPHGKQRRARLPPLRADAQRWGGRGTGGTGGGQGVGGGRGARWMGGRSCRGGSIRSMP